jgi:predicted nucleotidyltransferase
LRGAPEGLPFFWDERTLKDTSNFTLETALGAVDLLGHVSGADSFEGVWERSLVLPIDGLAVHVASLDDLIAMKRAANRPKDQNHLLELEALRRLIQNEP